MILSHHQTHTHKRYGAAGTVECRRSFERSENGGEENRGSLKALRGGESRDRKEEVTSWKRDGVEEKRNGDFWW